MEPSSKPVLARTLTWFALATYLLSFGLPTLGSAAPGVWAFVMCFLVGFGLFDVHGQHPPPQLIPLLTWAANPLFWCGAVLAFRGKWRGAAILGLAASACASALAVEATWKANTPEGNLLVGYPVWWSSMALLATAGLAGVGAAKSEERLTKHCG